MGLNTEQEKLIFGYISDYLSDEIADERASAFRDLPQDALESATQKFQNFKGQLQLELQSYYLREEQKQKIREYLYDPNQAVTQQIELIEDFGKKQGFLLLARRLVMATVFVGVSTFILWNFLPEKTSTFAPLEYLGYEASAIEQDDTRLELKSDNFEEIKLFFSNHPKLKFTPHLLYPLKSDWQYVGATVIDYEVAQVATTQLTNTKTNDNLFYFNYQGNIAALPPAETGRLENLTYQTYTTRTQNFVAFEYNGSMSFLVGPASAVELAEMAANGGAASKN